MLCFIIIFSGELTTRELDTDWSLAVAVGTVGAERESEEGEQIGILSLHNCYYFYFASACLVHELLGFCFYFFFFEAVIMMVLLH